jgi:hypothetical protein
VDHYKNTAPTSAKQEGTTALAFADIVGLGGGHALSRDISHLVISLFPLSSALICNRMGSFQESAILQELGLLTCRAALLSVANGEARRLGFLHVILKDIDQATLADLHFENKLLLQEPINSPGSVERNDIRAILNATFIDVCVWAIPRPFDNEKRDSVHNFHHFTKETNTLKNSAVCHIEQQSERFLEALTSANIEDKLSFYFNSTADSATSSMQSPLFAYQVAVAREAICVYHQQLSEDTNDLRRYYPMLEGGVSQRLSKKELPA